VALSRRLASLNQYPAVDCLDSISRLMKDVSTEEEVRLAGEVREIMSVYTEAQDLINIGAYVKGSNPKIDRAIEKIGPLYQLFRQGIYESCDHQATVDQLRNIIDGVTSGSQKVQVPA
jgi:flagellum-specific ATP synthase